MALAAYLKKELGEMIDEKVGRQITKVKDQVSAMASATDDGLKHIEKNILEEKVERSKWPADIEERMVALEFKEVEGEVGSSSGAGDKALKEKVQKIEAAFNEINPKSASQKRQQDKDAQVIFGGLKVDTNEEDVTKQVKTVISSVGLEDKIDDMFTFEDPSKVCVVQFKTPRAKIGFYKKVRHVQKVWGSGEEMWWKNNDSMAKKIVDKNLCQIKLGVQCWLRQHLRMKWQWAGRIANMNEERWAKRVTLWRDSVGQTEASSERDRPLRVRPGNRMRWED